MNHFVNNLYKLIEFSKNDVLKALRDPLSPLFSFPPSSLYNKKSSEKGKINDIIIVNFLSEDGYAKASAYSLSRFFLRAGKESNQSSP